MIYIYSNREEYGFNGKATNVSKQKFISIFKNTGNNCARVHPDLNIINLLFSPSEIRCEKRNFIYIISDETAWELIRFLAINDPGAKG